MGTVISGIFEKLLSKKKNNLIDINKVAIFVLVARLGTFTETAKRLTKPTNTISRYIQNLENDLGVRLFHRTTRKLTLTSAGIAFLARCAPAIEAINEASEEIKLDNQIARGVVR